MVTREREPRLRLSAITSSIEEMPISEFLAELWAIRVSAIDLYVRGCDVAASLRLEMEDLEHESLIERLAGPNRKTYVESLANYVRSERDKAAGLIKQEYGDRITGGDLQIPALATFFPELTSADVKTAESAAVALGSMVDLASKVGAKVVEFVMGKTVERCRREPSGKEHHCDYIYQYDAQTQIRGAVRLLDSLVLPLARERGIRLAAEIEPGFSYVLNDLARVGQYIDCVRKAKLEEYVGLNLDIGHLLIVNTTSPGQFEPGAMEAWGQHIFHAHCSDNVGYHFRDLVPGAEHNLFGKSETDFQPWVDVCLRCARNSQFSGYIAVELEGCSRIQWVQRSLMRLGYLLRTLPQPKAMPKKLPVSVRGSGRLSSTKVKTSKPKKLQCVKTILILTVRNEELDAIESAFKKCRGANRGGLQFRKNSGFYEGFFHKNTREQVRIVVGQFRDTGNEMSAVETSHYITKCEELYDTKPLYAILVGICAGSRKRHAELGDVVVPPYLFDKSVYKIEWVKGKKGSRGKKVTLNEIRTPGIPDAGLFGLCRRVAKEGLWAQTIDIARPEKPRTPYVHDDPLFTANAFLQDGGDYLEECRLSINRKVLAYEMEAGGFANACHRARVPFLVIRGISDFADDKTLDKTFWPYAGRTAAALALAIAKLGVIPD